MNVTGGAPRRDRISVPASGKGRSRQGRLLGSLLACLLAAIPSALPAAADYKLQPGDVLELSVAGIAEMKQRMPVGINGEVSVPLIGDVPAAGHTIAEVREKIRESIPKTALTLRLSGGVEQQTVIAGNEVSVTIVEYRPIYVTGDVAKPGELHYAPGITVRQAVSLVGGYDLQRFRMESPILATAELRSDYETLNIELAQEQAAYARLRAELDGKKTIDMPANDKLPIPAAVQQTILKTEQDLLTSRRIDYDKEEAHLLDTLQITKDRLVSIQEQYVKDKESAQFDSDELDRITDLNKRGIVPMNRQLDTRRLSLTTATRALQSGVEVEKAKRDRAEAARSIDRLRDQRRSDLLRDLQDMGVKIAQTKAKLSSVGEKLLYTGVVRSQLVRGSGGKPDIKVYRRQVDGPPQVLTADEDMVLQPGDTIEVALKIEYEFKPSSP
jgi:polysaccharide export outer membrane protein